LIISIGPTLSGGRKASGVNQGRPKSLSDNKAYNKPIGAVEIRQDEEDSSQDTMKGERRHVRYVSAARTVTGNPSLSLYRHVSSRSNGSIDLEHERSDWESNR
jgi:hypothetical protein